MFKQNTTSIAMKWIIINQNWNNKVQKTYLQIQIDRDLLPWTSNDSMKEKRTMKSVYQSLRVVVSVYNGCLLEGLS